MTVALQSIISTEDQYTSGAYGKRPLAIVRGQGCTVYDEAGNAYLDAGSGIGVAVLGHNHPAVVAAITQQAATLITCMEALYNDRRAELYALLATLTPADLNRVFLCNSGAEATEGAMKIARLLTGRTHIIAARRGFHGRTLGALGLTWNPEYREPFDGWTTSTVTHVTFNNLEAAEAAMTDDTAAIIVEPVQGEGGVHPADAAYLQGLRRLCDARGVLLIADEIQSGMGRTGRWFAFEHAGIVPDMITLAKGLAGGVPMGAVIWREVLGTIPIGSHGSTFGGNPLACAAAIATLTTLRDENVLAQCEANGAWFLAELAAMRLPQVREIRGQGLMIGLELRGRVTPILKALQERGIIALPAGKTVLRLLPPLIITREELQTLLHALGDVLS
ncbi:MAG: aspartate aminotransferase family protein [Anaerolineae bacterium]